MREIEVELKSCEGKLAHLGIEAPAHPSLSYANGHRPWALFEKVFHGLYETVAASVRTPRKLRFEHKRVSLDSTVSDLCLSLYDWAKFGRTKGGGQAASGARSRRLSALFRYPHRGLRP